MHGNSMKRKGTAVKRITAMILMAILILSFTGCGKKSVIDISVEGIGEYEVLQMPDNLVNYSKNDNVITITVKENGDYDFVVQDDEGQEYSFTLKYDDGDAEAQTEDDISVNLSIQ